MRGPFLATAARIPLSSRHLPSQHDLHAVLGDFYPTPVKLGALRRRLVEYRVGVVHMDQNPARARRQPLEPFEHPAGPALGQMPDIARTLAREPEADHLVVRPERAVYQHARGRLHGTPDALLHSTQAGRIERSS